MFEPGVYRNKDMGRQLKIFEGLKFGSKTPTDIDCFFDIGNRLFIFIEGKFNGAKISTGQMLALQRVADACNRPPKMYGVSLIVDHNEPLGNDVIYAETMVRLIRMHGGWHKPKEPICLKDAVAKLIKYSDMKSDPVLTVVKGVADE